MVHWVLHRCLCSSSSHHILFDYRSQGLCHLTEAHNPPRDLRGTRLQTCLVNLGVQQIHQTPLLLHSEEEGEGGPHQGEHGGDRVDGVELPLESHECILCLLCSNFVPVHVIDPRFASRSRPNCQGVSNHPAKPCYNHRST